jgi:L-amino acid ligase C-terminal domain 2
VIVSKGDTIGDLRSSWDRVAMVEAGGQTADEALRTAQQALELITIEVA